MKGWIDIMPDLRCSITNCMHNKNEMCCLENINVSGNGAHTNDETCCESFTPQGATNSVQMGEQSPDTCISCSAKECKHNNGTSCTAQHVAISGKCESTACSQTKCSTFACCK